MKDLVYFKYRICFIKIFKKINYFFKSLTLQYLKLINLNEKSRLISSQKINLKLIFMPNFHVSYCHFFHSFHYYEKLAELLNHLYKCNNVIFQNFNQDIYI